MARTYRTRHLSPAERARRGGKLDSEYRDRPLKTEKQRRPSEKTKLRKEYL